MSLRMSSSVQKQPRLDNQGLLAQALYTSAPPGSLPLETLEALALCRFVVLLCLTQLRTEEERMAVTRLVLLLS
jgi:hypothetical protein